MSWEDYIKQMKEAKVNKNLVVEKAVIWGINPVSAWTRTGDLIMTEDEIKVLIGDRTNFSCSGPRIAGVKCMLIQDNTEDPSIYSLNLKTVQDADGQSYPVCVGRSKTALVIARGFSNTAAGALTDVVFGVVNHLQKNDI